MPNQSDLNISLHISDNPDNISRDDVIHLLIKHFAGVQDHANGTVVCRLFGPEGVLPEQAPTVDLYIHDWE